MGAYADFMRLSSLTDPVDVARAQAALDLAWLKIQSLNLPDLGSVEAERCRLSYIVSGLLQAAAADNLLADKAVARFIDYR